MLRSYDQTIKIVNFGDIMGNRVINKVFIYINRVIKKKEKCMSAPTKTKTEYNVLDVANTFIEMGIDKNFPVTNMKLQKLLYYAQGWYLALTNKPLFDDDFEKWDFGPVCPVIYEKFKDKKAQPIICTDIDGDVITNEGFLAFISKIWEMYGDYTGIQLSKLSHIESPWIEADFYRIIPKQKIKDFFCAKLSKGK